MNLRDILEEYFVGLGLEYPDEVDDAIDIVLTGGNYNETRPRRLDELRAQLASDYAAGSTGSVDPNDFLDDADEFITELHAALIAAKPQVVWNSSSTDGKWPRLKAKKP